MKGENKKTPYELENSFDRRALETPHGRRKVKLFSAIIPHDCKSILDAGGGTGWCTMGVRRGRRVVTLDNSPRSLAHAPGEKILADIDNLPFADRCFDMVLSSQVLEHLRDEVFHRATSEMTRVARHYLLVSVPYREALETRFVRCNECGCVFHPHYHCRSFTERQLAALFPGWIMAEWHVFGSLRWAVGVDPLRPARLRRPKEKLPIAPETTICPKCGTQGNRGLSDSEEEPMSFRQRFNASAKRRLGRVFPALLAPAYPTFLPQNVAPYWIAALFIREEAAQLDGDSSEYLDGFLHEK